jgi:hypothetical protein
MFPYNDLPDDFSDSLPKKLSKKEELELIEFIETLKALQVNWGPNNHLDDLPKDCSEEVLKMMEFIEVLKAAQVNRGPITVDKFLAKLLYRLLTQFLAEHKSDDAGSVCFPTDSKDSSLKIKKSKGNGISLVK